MHAIVAENGNLVQLNFNLSNKNFSYSIKIQQREDVEEELKQTFLVKSDFYFLPFISHYSSKTVIHLYNGEQCFSVN